MELYNKFLTTTLVVLFFAFSAIAQESKNISESFTISSNGTVTIENSFGKVDVKTSANNKVTFKITVETKAKENAKKILDAITVDFDNSSNAVSAVTQFDKNKLKSLSKKNVSYSVNYEVMMPKSAMLDISHDFGDVSVAELSNNAKIDMSYGKLLMLGVGGDLDANIEFCTGSTVEKASNANLQMNYSELSFGTVNKIDCKGDFSQLFGDDVNMLDLDGNYNVLGMDKIGTLNVEGDHNNFEIDNVKSITIDGDYAIGSIDELNTTFVSHGDFVSISVDDVNQGFETIEMKGQYTNFEIEIDGSANYAVDVSGSYVNFEYPDGIQFSKKEKNTMSKSYEGQMGSGSGGKIYARIDFGNLNID